MVNGWHVAVVIGIVGIGGYLIYRAFSESKKKKEDISPLKQALDHPHVRKAIKEITPKYDLLPASMDLPPKAVSSANLGRFISY